jgi:hypothetical protein
VKGPIKNKLNFVITIRINNKKKSSNTCGFGGMQYTSVCSRVKYWIGKQ